MAHADDETLGCGGTICKLTNWNVEVVIVADGVVRMRGIEQDNREHAARACERLGVGPPRFLGFPDQRFDTIPMADLANAVAALGLEPDLILTHVETDLNRDHRLVCEVAKIIGRPRRKPVSILGCEIPSTTFWNGVPFVANYYVDISDTIDAKMDAFAFYEHEIESYPHPWSKEGLRLLAEYHGMQSGVRFAEAFSVIRGYDGRMPGDGGDGAS
jgi:LmbE family N-acetylglucosaminyl deacetylase